MERRLFLKGVGVLGSAILLKGSVNPSQRTRPENSGNYTIYPGWIEANIDAPIIEPGKGHKEWLTQGVFNNPIVKATTQDLFHLQNGYYQQGKRARLGDLFWDSIMLAGDRIVALDPKEVYPPHQEWLFLETVHTATYAFATSLLPWLSKDRLDELGAILPENNSMASNFWGVNGRATVSYPKVLGAGETNEDKILQSLGNEPHDNGLDRSAHFAQYFMLGFNYRYARQFGISLGLPWITDASLFLEGLFLGRSLEIKTISNLVNFGYEVKTTPGGLEQLLDKEIVTEGLLDRRVGEDLEAGCLGIVDADKLWDIGFWGGDISPLIRALNNTESNKDQTLAVCNF